MLSMIPLLHTAINLYNIMFLFALTLLASSSLAAATEATVDEDHIKKDGVEGGPDNFDGAEAVVGTNVCRFG